MFFKKCIGQCSFLSLISRVKASSQSVTPTFTQSQKPPPRPRRKHHFKGLCFPNLLPRTGVFLCCLLHCPPRMCQAREDTRLCRMNHRSGHIFHKSLLALLFTLQAWHGCSGWVAAWDTYIPHGGVWFKSWLFHFQSNFLLTHSTLRGRKEVLTEVLGSLSPKWDSLTEFWLQPSPALGTGSIWGSKPADARFLFI